MPRLTCSSSNQAAPSESSRRPWDAWSTVMACAAKTDGLRYVTPVTSNPSRMRDVAPARAASVVMPSNVSPGPSPYIGWKWSKPQAPSKPSSSANCTRLTTSSHGMRCCATSSPNRIVVLLLPGVDHDTAASLAGPEWARPDRPCQRSLLRLGRLAPDEEQDGTDEDGADGEQADGAGARAGGRQLPA